MADIWFISDTHFLHNNILKFKTNEGLPLRNFASCKEMDEYMIRCWNSKIKPQDKVYHLGDVTFQYNGLFNEIMSQLNGHKRLIVGNHDKLNPSLMRWFDKVELWTGGKFKKHGFVASHIPLREDQMRGGEFNVHGHLHSNLIKNPRYVSVCVEQIDYTPVHLDELKVEFEKRRQEILYP